MLVAALIYAVSSFLERGQAQAEEGRHGQREPVPRILVVPARSKTVEGSSRVVARAAHPLLRPVGSCTFSDGSDCSDTASCRSSALCSSNCSTCLDALNLSADMSSYRSSVCGSGGSHSLVPDGPDRLLQSCPGEYSQAGASEAGNSSEGDTGAQELGGCDGRACEVADSEVQDTWMLWAVVSELTAKLTRAIQQLGERERELEQLGQELSDVRAMHLRDVEVLARRLKEGGVEAEAEAGAAALEPPAVAPQAVVAAAMAARTREMHTLLTFMHA